MMVWKYGVVLILDLISFGLELKTVLDPYHEYKTLKHRSSVAELSVSFSVQCGV